MEAGAFCPPPDAACHAGCHAAHAAHIRRERAPRTAAAASAPGRRRHAAPGAHMVARRTTARLRGHVSVGHSRLDRLDDRPVCTMLWLVLALVLQMCQTPCHAHPRLTPHTRTRTRRLALLPRPAAPGARPSVSTALSPALRPHWAASAVRRLAHTPKKPNWRISLLSVMPFSPGYGARHRSASPARTFCARVPASATATSAPTPCSLTIAAACGK